MSYASISSFIRDWFGCHHEPPHPPADPRVYQGPDYRKLHGEARAEAIAAEKRAVAAEARAVRAERRARETWALLEQERATTCATAKELEQLKADDRHLRAMLNRAVRKQSPAMPAAHPSERAIADAAFYGQLFNGQQYRAN